MSDLNSLAGAGTENIIGDATPPAAEHPAAEAAVVETPGTPTQAAEHAVAAEPDAAVVTDDLGYTEDIDHPVVKGIVDVFKDSGIPVAKTDELFKKVLETGNPADLDEAGIREVLGSKADLVLSAAKGILLENKARQEGIKTAFFTAVGGEKAWETIKAWVSARESTDPEFKVTVDSYRNLVNTGAEGAVLVANALKGMYSQANTTRKPALVSGDSVPSTSAMPILSEAEFGAKYSAAFSAGDKVACESILSQWRAGGGSKK